MSKANRPDPAKLYIFAILLVVAGFSLYTMNIFIKSTNRILSLNEKGLASVTNSTSSVRIADTPECPPHCPVTPIDEPQPDSGTTTTPSTYKPPKTTTPKTTTPSGGVTGTPKPTAPKEYALPELTEEQKLDEAKGLNPYSTFKIQINPTINIEKLGSWSYELQVRQDLKDALKETPDLTTINTDNEEQIITEDTQIRIATSFEEEMEALQEALENPEENIVAVGPASDSDSDGLGDLIEIANGTNFLDSDSDNDGISDQDEFDLGSDPLESTEVDYTAGVSNLNNGVIGEETFIKGIANPGETVTIEAINIETEEKFILGQFTADENGKFAGIGKFSSGDPGAGRPVDGNYYVYSNHLTPEGQTDTREIAKVTVDTVSQRPVVETQIAEKVKTGLMAKIENTRNWMNTFLGPRLYNGLFASTVESVPDGAYLERLMGTAEPGDIIIVTWKSFILSSVVIADASQGRFEVAIPDKLPVGNHEIFVYSYNPRTNFFSSITKLIFAKII